MEVQAKELSTGVASSIVVKPSYGLGDADIEQMIKDSYASAASDKEQRALQESRVEAQRIIEALESALEENGKELLSAEEYETLVFGMRSLQDTIKNDDSDAIRDEAEALNEASLVFAGRRMDTQIKSALTGHTLEEYE
jgi:molecular chaperone HscA